MERIHANKTARLIAAAMEVGGVIGGAGNDLRHALRNAGLLAGRAFQIVDDVLDLETDKETLGKTPGKDVKEGKLTYPSIVGVEEARKEAGRLVEASIAALSAVLDGPGADRLREAITFVAERAA